jgi:transcriptional regulator with XRE-family HTH domain
MARKRNPELARAIGARARQLRLSAALTQERLGERLDVQPEAISRFENGGGGLSVSTLLDMANALGVPLSRFFEEPEASASGDGAEERALLDQWRKLPEPYREQVRAILRWARSDILVHDQHASRPPDRR